MIQEIELKGISNSPSDHECADGELGTCLNLINEDGALKPIYPTAGDTSLKLDETITDGDNAGVYKRTIRFVHKVTHGDETHIHYIAYVYTEELDDKDNNGYLWQWYEPTTGEWKDIGIANKDFNSVNAIGNILCFVGEDNVLYSYWNEFDYIVFDLNQLKYKIHINVKQNFIGENKTTIVWDTETHHNPGHAHDIDSPSASEVSSAIDSICNKFIEDNSSSNYFNFITFGVCAIRLFDGTYTNISSPFILPPARHNNKYLVNSKTKELDYKAYLRSFAIMVELTIPKYLNKIIDGVDVFVTQSYSFFKNDKGLFTNSIHTNDCEFWRDDFDKSIVFPCAIDFMERKDICKAFESATYRLSTHIENDELNKYVDIKRIVGTEQELTLVDFKWNRFGGECSFIYNNRLHIGNVDEICDDYIFSTNAFQRWNRKNINVTGFNTEPYDLAINERIDVDSTYSNTEDYYCEAVYQIETQLGSSGTNVNYVHAWIQYPIPPLLAIPTDNATRLILYFRFSGKCYKKEFPLTNSSNSNMSYYINFGERLTNRGNGVWFSPDAGGVEDYSVSQTPINNPSFATFRLSDTFNLPQFIQVYRERLVKGAVGYAWDGKKIANKGFTEITEEDFKKVLDLCDDKNFLRKRYPNLIRVSEAENPLVFPASNSVQVGSSVVKSLASNTHTISEGQFGTAPLYAFTDEGVWALITTGEGTYEARQPVNRDIVSNPDGIISTDDAVLYPTKRGIMLIQGTSSECITEALRGNPFRFTDLFRKDFAKKVLDINGIPDTAVDPIDFDKFLENANMTFDYKDQRLILYNNEVDYAYVFSFKSKMWGAMECDFKYNVNVYPDSYVVTKDGNIKNIHNDEPTEDTRYLVCTRPLVFGSPEHFKTMLTTIVRGYFRNKPGKCGIVLYASNDLFNWMPIATSVDKYLRGIAGSPYKYFRVALTGSLSVEESISGFSSDIQERWQNKLR